MSWLWFALHSALASGAYDKYAGTTLVEADPFLWVTSTATTEVGKAGNISLKLVIPDGNFVYRDQIEVTVLESSGLRFGKLILPQGKFEADPADAANTRESYTSDILVSLPFSATTSPGLYTVKLELKRQGCRPGLCFPPKIETVEVLVRVAAR